ncbi:hypothetical protein K435DRAFT_808934 [Dendrothele bispora CBS 962.96]|uniref:Uncharacterized protein n=1 Tax=Dendrothele bispora (strain CBS 962.96) TaxID=1314807 RepID=A0A4S8L106_DENBC|nr:hypothetical protein K435DRAFT_808934 [Dendrothele bispora CBS 962.96]
MWVKRGNLTKNLNYPKIRVFSPNSPMGIFLMQFTSVLQDNGEASKKATHGTPSPNEVLNSPRNSVNSTIVTTSVLTKRQIQLRDETEALRDQIKILQQAVLSSNVELQREIARMGAHMQRLESMWNSDWARGISDDPPPHYES